MRFYSRRTVYKAFVRVRNGGRYVEEDFDMLLGSRGFLSRLFRPVFNLIRKSWHMYPLGILFGLGFDTATEIGLLGMSAAEATKGLAVVGAGVSGAVCRGDVAGRTADNILMLALMGGLS
jgi:nickel/cobalt transporter (NiCoT) family protein